MNGCLDSVSGGWVSGFGASGFGGFGADSVGVRIRRGFDGCPDSTGVRIRLLGRRRVGRRRVGVWIRCRCLDSVSCVDSVGGWVSGFDAGVRIRWDSTEGWVSGFRGFDVHGRVGVRIPRDSTGGWATGGWVCGFRVPRKGGCPDSARIPRPTGGWVSGFRDCVRREGGCPDSAGWDSAGVRIPGFRVSGFRVSDSASGFRAGFDALPDSALRVRRILLR